ncbi:MAG: helix-turn-helix transcriptional regulator [Candidatus Gastranaerophilales bacterium]
MKKMFGKRLRELRLQRNLTQEKMSEIINVSPESFCRLEHGISFPKPENIEKISQALDVEIFELFEFSHLKNSEQNLPRIIDRLKDDNELVVLVYKFLKTLGKI